MEMTVGELLEQLQRAQGLGTTNNKNRMLLRWSYNAIMALAERVSLLELKYEPAIGEVVGVTHSETINYLAPEAADESRSPDGDGPGDPVVPELVTEKPDSPPVVRLMTTEGAVSGQPSPELNAGIGANKRIAGSEPAGSLHTDECACAQCQRVM